MNECDCEREQTYYPRTWRVILQTSSGSMLSPVEVIGSPWYTARGMLNVSDESGIVFSAPRENVLYCQAVDDGA